MPAPPDGAVYLLEARIGPKGKRTRYDHWEVRGVYLTWAEADAARRAEWRDPHGLRVTWVRAVGALAALVADAGNSNGRE